MKCTHYIYFMDSPGLCATAPRIISTKELLLIHPHPQWALAIWILNDLNHCHHYGLAAKKNTVDRPGRGSFWKSHLEERNQHSGTGLFLVFNDLIKDKLLLGCYMWKQRLKMDKSWRNQRGTRLTEMFYFF